MTLYILKNERNEWELKNGRDYESCKPQNVNNELNDRYRKVQPLF